MEYTFHFAIFYITMQSADEAKETETGTQQETLDDDFTNASKFGFEIHLSFHRPDLNYGSLDETKATWGYKHWKICDHHMPSYAYPLATDDNEYEENKKRADDFNQALLEAINDVTNAASAAIDDAVCGRKTDKQLDFFVDDHYDRHTTVRIRTKFHHFDALWQFDTAKCPCPTYVVIDGALVIDGRRPADENDHAITLAI